MMECLDAWEREIFLDYQVTGHRSLLWKRVADECAGEFACVFVDGGWILCSDSQFPVYNLYVSFF
jgi:hypothetical protein